MSTSPEAEWPIDDVLVRRLLAEQCPDLAELSLTYYRHGWDNEMYRLGEGLLVRLPRRERSAPLMAHEIEWLPKLADHVTTYIPRPIFAGAPSTDFPWPWSIVPYASGRRGNDVPVADRTAAAEGLADFFGSLHIPAPLDAPENPVRGLSLDQPRFDERAAARIAARPDQREELTRRWRAWSTVPEWDGPDLWVHGDIHPLNLLLGDDGALVGVVDWGDITSGDPACDLAGAWLTFDEEGRRRFFARADSGLVYDEHIWDRAKAWALYLGLLFAENSDDMPPLREVGEHAIAAVLAEPIG